MGRQYASMVFVNVMWGLSFIFSKHAMLAGFPALTLAFLRYVVAASLLCPMVLFKEKRMRLAKRDVAPMFLSALVGITLYYAFEYAGIQRTSTVNASLILAAIPIITMIVEAVVYRTGLNTRQILGSFVSLAGVALVVATGADEENASIVGDLCILGAAIVWVCYIFISRSLRNRYSSLSMNAWQALASLATLLPMALTEQAQWQPVPWDGWAAMIILAVVCSALCYWIYGNALLELSPLASAIFINLIPLTTILGGVFFLGESLSWLQGLGGVLIVSSIFVINLSGSKKKACKTR
ncbi:MAG: DMT family transporter [Clostridia bacterium]|nr:DMT family transporter [Clostridia bacterium]